MPELRNSSEPVVVRFSDADSGGPIAEHVVEWFDGENSIAVTRTDETGLAVLSASAVAATTPGTTLEARISRPHGDPMLPPVVVATTTATIDPDPAADEGAIIDLDVKPAGFARMREAGAPDDRAAKRDRIIDALGLTGERLKRRIGEDDFDESMPAHRAAEAAMFKIGLQLHEYDADTLPPGIKHLVDSFRNRQKCTCAECESALSPLAYLAHLLDYTVRHVVNVGPPPSPLTLAQLQSQFGQKFSTLTQSCDASETVLAQALIAIEVLENHYARLPLTAPQQAALDRQRAAQLLDAYLVLLQRMGVPYDDLRLADTTEKKAQVAELLGVEPARVDALLLDPLLTAPNPNALTADRLAKIFGFASGQGTSAPAMPDLLAWRYESLSRRWEDEDQPADDPLDGKPVIDPDVIGPDDFRRPAAKSSPAALDEPFDVWLRRRAYIDAAQATLGGLATVTAMFTRMYQSFPYEGDAVVAWDAATAVTDFPTIESALLTGSQVDANTERLDTDLAMPTAAFHRLLELQRKDALARAVPPRGDPLTSDERAELLSILGGCVKRRAFASWVQEERAAGFAVDPKYFWAPRRTAVAGAWPRLRAPGEPLIDPGTVSANSLPEGAYGATARALLDARTTALSNRRNTIAAARESQGFPQCVNAGLSWWAVPTGSTAVAEVRALAQDLAAPATEAAARTRIETELFMTVEDFAQVVQIDQREQAGERLAAGDYEVAYQILTAAYRKQRFPTWVGQETAPYWELLKQALVPWRATADDRARWRAALRAASEPVVVDPDLLYASDFLFNARAYSLFLARTTEVANHVTALRTQVAAARATPPTAVERTALDALLTSELQVSAQDLLDLEAASDEGQDSEWRLGQLLLDPESLSELTRIIRLAATVAGTKRLLDREWEALFSICTQVWKRRERALAWRDDERRRSTTVRPITLSSDFFKILPPPHDVFPPPSLPPLPRWRASAFDRVDWTDKLQSRIDLKANMLDAWRTSLRGAEEIALPKLRDVLLAADHAGRPVVEVAKALEREYLIDFRMGGCATVTRVSQAIETVQALLEGLRTRQSPLIQRYDIALTTGTATKPAYEFAAFDEDVTWLGSYASWRSAMYIQLFTENVLSPSLREHQTYGFRQLVTSLRSSPRLTPDEACHYASEYAEYLNDVMGLTLGGCVNANIRNADPSCTSRRLAPTRNVEFLVALAPSGTLYFSMRDTGPAATLSYAQSTWMPVEEISGVVAVLGAVVYEPQSAGSENTRSIAVLVKLSGTEGPRLGLLSFDLDTAEWSSLKDLALPTGFADFDASFVTTSTSPTTSERPVVEISPLPSGNGQVRSVNVALTDWDRAAFQPRTFGVELHYASNTDLNWSTGATWYRNAENMNRATEWAKARGFVAAIPTFRTVNGLNELVAFDSRFVGEENFQGNDARVPWGALLWFARKSYASDTVNLIDDDDQTVDWLQVTTTAARAVANAGYLAAFPKFVTDMPVETSLQYQSSKLPFHIYAFKPSDSVTTGTAPHQSLDSTLFDNLGVLESPLAGFHRAIQQYATAQGYAAGIPTWWVVQGTTPTIGDDILGTSFDQNTVHEVVFFKKGDGYRRRIPTCANLANWKPYYPAGQPKFAFYHKPTAKDFAAWRSLIVKIYAANTGQTPENLNYVDEGSYFVPVMVAMSLHQAGEYEAALEWFRLAVDWTLGPEQAITQSQFLARHSKVTASFNVTDDWLRDPLHPHLIAATRPRAYTRFTYLSVVRCYLDYADADYAAENVARAKRNYQRALDLLRASVFAVVDPCAPVQTGPQLDPDVVGKVTDKYRPEIENVLREITPLDEMIRQGIIEKVKDLIEGDGLGPGLPDLWEEIELERDQLPGPRTLEEVMKFKDDFVRDLAASLPSHEDFRAELDLAVDAALIRRDGTLELADRNEPGGRDHHGGDAGTTNGNGAPPGMMSTSYAFTGNVHLEVELAPELSDVYGVGAGYGLLTGALNPFCIPVNPLMRALRLHAEVNIHKIENCRNIAGMKRTLDLYGAPTDTTTGMPSIGAGGELVMPGLVRLSPTQYRFHFLLERARQLVQLAQQMESALLSALVQKDAVSLSVFKAKQDVRLARSELTLQDLTLKQSGDELALTTIQQERAMFQVSHYSILLNADLNAHEMASLVLSAIALAHSIGAGIALMSSQQYIAGVQAFGQAWSQKAAIAATLATYERRREDWLYQRRLAQFDVSTANQQQILAQDGVQIATQQRAVAELKTTIAEDTVEYLTTKQFVTEELAAMLVETYEGLVRSRLQAATSVAHVASTQLAFERQEEPPEFIQPDYSRVKEDLTSDLGQPPDRKGLTGSARLLNDIELLAQHAIDTDQRKLHLTKTISLAQLAPLEFAQFRETGVLTVATPMSLFDQDFPGHYLRLVKRVRVSLAALIPPTTGIKATLTASATSRVVVEGDMFQTVRLQHGPDLVALTSTQNATGVFDFDVQSEMLAPFEGIGVDTNWEFRLPKAANQFDYDTIANVYLTLDYSALFSYEYQEIVIGSMRPTVEAERGFSFRHDFADAWYDLVNPALSPTPMTVRFRTTADDFPANLDNVRISNVALGFMRKDGTPFEMAIAGLTFTPDGEAACYGGAAETVEGIASTRRGNAQTWGEIVGLTPSGVWELALPNSTIMRNRFSSELIEDIVLVVSFAGRRPAWP